MYPNDADEETLNDGKKKKKILNSIRRSKSRRYSFKHVTAHIGRGERSSLKRVHEENSDAQIIKTHMGKENIKKAIIEHNCQHFTKAHQSKVYQDKTCKEFQNNRIRKKISHSDLREDACNNEEVHEFLSLLKKSK